MEPRSHAGRATREARIKAVILALACVLAVGGNDDALHSTQEDEASPTTAAQARRTPTEAAILDEPTPSPEPSLAPTPVYRVPEPAEDAGDYPEALREAVCRADFLWDCEGALRIATCEMGVSWRPDAIGLAGERGIFQIHPIHSWRWPDYYEGSMIPERNAEMAHSLFLSVGSKWSPTWSCATLLGIS